MRNAPGRLVAVLVAAVALLSAIAAPALAQSGQPWKNTRLSPDQRATLLANAMNMEQKLRLFEANPSSPSPELGIPSRKEKDGCCGVSLADSAQTPTTGLPITTRAHISAS